MLHCTLMMMIMYVVHLDDFIKSHMAAACPLLIGTNRYMFFSANILYTLLIDVCLTIDGKE